MLQSNTMKRSLMLGVGATALFFAMKPNKMQNLTSKIKQKVMPSKYQNHGTPDIEKTGNPLPNDIDDNKMVDEGAMTSVQYYNDVKQQ